MPAAQQAAPLPQEEAAAGAAAESPDLIARRTRAHVSLVDLDLEQLEKCLAARRPSRPATLCASEGLTFLTRVVFPVLQLDDEGDFLFDDNDEYAAFLEELQAPWDALPVRCAGGASLPSLL